MDNKNLILTKNPSTVNEFIHTAIEDKQSCGDIMMKFNVNCLPHGYLRFSFLNYKKYHNYTIINSANENIELNVIKIYDNFRHKGYGRKLMQEFLSYIDENYPESDIYLTALDIENKDYGYINKLVSFYKSFGFMIQEINSNSTTMYKQHDIQ